MRKRIVALTTLLAIAGTGAVLVEAAEEGVDAVPAPEQVSAAPGEGRPVEGSPILQAEPNSGEVAAAQPSRQEAPRKKPVSGIIVGDPQYLSSDGRLFVSGSTTFVVKVVGGVSGIAKTEYRIDGGSWKNYEPFTLPDEGPHLIEYHSVDNAGNEESPRSVSVVVDKTPPVSTASMDGKPLVPGKASLLGKNRVVTLEVNDEGAGSAGSEYRLNQGEWQSYSPFTLPAKGVYTILFRSSDRLGNREVQRSFTVTSEKIPVTTSLVAGEPKFLMKDGIAITEATPLTLAVESMTGVSSTEFRVDEGQWRRYSAPFTVTGEGSHRVFFRSVDDAGGKEPEKFVDLVVDAKGPEADIYAGEAKLERNASGIYNKRVDFKLTAVDSVSGLKTLEYRINDGGWVPYAPFGFDAEGKYVIEYRATDGLGNAVTGIAFTAVVDRTPPAGELVAGDPKKEENGLIYVAPGTLFTPKGTDGGAGLDKVEYSIDGWEDTLDEVPFSIATPGKYRVDFQGIDKAGNKEPLKTVLVVVDPAMQSKDSSDAKADVGPGEKRRVFKFEGKPAGIVTTPVAAVVPAPETQRGYNGINPAVLPVPGVIPGAAYMDDMPMQMPGSARRSLLVTPQEPTMSFFEYVGFGLAHIVLIVGVMLL